MIALGFVLFLAVSYYHPLRAKITSSDDYFSVLFIGLLTGIIGGRIGFVVTHLDFFIHNWTEIFLLWTGGFTSQGAIISIAFVVPWYLHYKKIPLLPFLDLAAIHAPLLQAVGRLGCLFAGCCYGASAAATTPLAVIFTNPNGSGPLFTPLYPIQLYTSVASLLFFMMLYTLSFKSRLLPGLLAFIYLFAESGLRFTTDFWRGDREKLYFIKHILLSQSQITSFVVMSISCIGILLIFFNHYRSRKN